LKSQVTQLVKKFPDFYGPEGSLQCSQGPYPKSEVSSPQLPILFP